MLRADTVRSETGLRMSIFPPKTHGFLPFIIVAAGVAVAVFVFSVLQDDAEHQAVVRFDDAADTAGLAITTTIQTHVQTVLSVQDLYRASTFVTRAEFAQFITRPMQLNPGVQALEWIPRVTRADRSLVTARAQDDGFPNFTITERNDEGQLVSAGERDEYFPVYYLEPLEGNEAALGFDLGSNPIRLAALDEARDTGEVVVSGRIRLVQESGDQFGVLVFAPVYAGGSSPSNVEDRRNSLEGFVLGVFRIGDVIAAALAHEDLHEAHADVLDIELFDLSAPAESQLLYSSMADPSGDGAALPEYVLREEADTEHFGLSEVSDLDNRTDYFFFEYGFRSYVLKVSSLDPIYSTNYRTPVLGTLGVLFLSVISAIAVSTARARFRARNEFAVELSRLIDTAGVPIMDVDDAQNLIVWNTQMEQITGIPARMAIGKVSLADFIVAEDVELLSYNLNRVIETGEIFSDIEIGVKSIDDQISRVVFNGAPRLNPAGGRTGVFVIGQDITERVETANERNRLLEEKADLVRKLLESQEEERGGIAFDLHDGPAQHLSGASMFLESYVAIKDEIDSTERDSMISTAKGYVGSALEEIQRIMAGLRPSALDDLGLVQGLRESVSEVSRRTGHAVEFLTQLDENIEIDDSIEIVLYRISQEAVNNAVKHSGEGTISVELNDNNGTLVLEIRDRGAGFDFEAVMNSPERRGMGLLGMRERAGLIGADLSVDSTMGKGTTVTISLSNFENLEKKSD